jgi:hypothetical protein
MHNLLKQIESSVLSFSKLNGIHIESPFISCTLIILIVFSHSGDLLSALLVQFGVMIADNLAEIVNYTTKAEGMVIIY